MKALGLGLHFPIVRLDCQLASPESDVGHELLVDGLDCSADWNISFFRLQPSTLWCTFIGSPRGAGLWAPKGSLLERCRGVCHEVTLEDLIPRERLEEWRRVCSMAEN